MKNQKHNMLLNMNQCTARVPEIVFLKNVKVVLFPPNCAFTTLRSGNYKNIKAYTYSVESV